MARDAQDGEIDGERHVRFLREHDGPVEREFKAAIRDELATTLRRAFLVLIDYGPGSPQSVALCFVSREDEDATAERIGRVFSRMFKGNQHLDIVALRSSDVERVAAVARPFISTEP